jgi:hypothetical protein
LKVETESVSSVSELKYRVVNGTEEENFLALCDAVAIPCWPEFMLNDSVANRYWARLYEVFPEYQFALREESTGELIAVGNSVPLFWDRPPEDLPDEGWDWALDKAFQDHERGFTPTVQCALQIAIPPAYRGQRLSGIMIEFMKEIGARHNLTALLAPIRPVKKHLYPLTDIEVYMNWEDADGRPFDPWLAAHLRAGARKVKVCRKAMRIEGTVATWEQWTGMRFPDSGQYVIPGALLPITIDRDQDQGLYVEPNYWMHHPIEKRSPSEDD